MQHGYLHPKPIWLQLIIFFSLVLGFFIAAVVIGNLLLQVFAGVSVQELDNIKALDPAIARVALRGASVIQFFGLFLLPCAVFAYLAHPRPKHYLGLRPPTNAPFWLLGIAIMVLSLPMVEGLGLLNRSVNFGPLQKSLQQGEAKNMDTIKVLLGGKGPSELLLNILFVAAAAGIGEELLFRGVLQRLFIRGTRSAWLGIFIAAFLFAFVHFQFFGFLPRLVLGMLLGAMYWYSRSLWVPILAHFVYDAAIITLVYFNPEQLQNPEAPTFAKALLPWLAAGSAAVVALCLWQMKRLHRQAHGDPYAELDASVPSAPVYFLNHEDTEDKKGAQR